MLIEHMRLGYLVIPLTMLPIPPGAFVDTGQVVNRMTSVLYRNTACRSEYIHMKIDRVLQRGTKAMASS